mmetsp:Transcript_36477/g.66845  ORF Transcript_36477/g.66845 Transcript_36477/m.66845 type:complete len:125 (-) Transcript_36477:36-410(-)
MARGRSPLALVALMLGLLCMVGRIAVSFVSSSPGQATRSAVTARQFMGKEGGSLSPDDDYKMPKSKEEEAQILQEKGFWKSEFDDLSDGEKVTSPPVVFILVLITIPFAISAIGLIQAGVLDAD